jgi:hypothetical protein
MLKSKLNTLLSALLLAIPILLSALPQASAGTATIPVLNWQQRSDWVNVKTSITPAAVGDGVKDDTAAIQAALNRIDNNYISHTKTVYLPAGTYRITKTLMLTKVMGAMIVGTGKTTRIIWDGPLNQPMYLSNGAGYSRYVGLSWDGQNKASVGIDHESRTYFETRIRHQDESFANFRVSGIQAGANQIMATAEVMYRNCLFQNCANGVSLLQYNQYDHDFDGCLFQDCGTAINCARGNVYVRDCNFERSKVTDMYLCPHSHSVRRCTSVGSNQFIFVPNTYNGCEVTVEDCRVSGWTGRSGAIAFGARGPDTVFDCVFTNPPDRNPPIRLANWFNGRQLISVCNNSAPTSLRVVDSGFNSSIVTIPNGARSGNLSAATGYFLKSTETLPGTIIDVKKDYGALGDGHTDDTAAIVRALFVAGMQGNGCILYFQPGVYPISATLPVQGSNYTIGGAGFGSTIRWAGQSAGPIFAVQDPHNITIEQLNFESPDAVACIQQRSSSPTAPSTITYDGLYVFGSWLGTGNTGGENGHIGSTRANRGVELTNLSSASTVHLIHLDGSAHFTNCSQATILTNNSFDGVIQVDGAANPKTGFLGFLMRLATGNPCNLIVRDNQDFVGTNFYCEQTQSDLAASGDGALVGQPGHITLAEARNHTYSAPANINNYEGRITYVGAQFNGNPPHAFVQTGTRPADIVLLDNMFWAADPTLETGLSGQATVIQNIIASDATDWTHVVVNQLPKESATVTASLLSNTPAAIAVVSPQLVDVAAALDDFRLLGAVDLAINHP